MLLHDDAEPYPSRWPLPLMVLAVLTGAFAVFLAYHAMRGQDVLGMDWRLAGPVAILSLFASMNLGTLAARRRRRQARPPP